MLDLAAIDLGELSMALDDNSPETRWYLDRRTGEVHFVGADDDLDERAECDDWVWIEPIGSDEAYRDMEDFVALVRDRRAAGLLARAIEGRGAFRRFKDTLFEFPELREQWFAFKEARMARRAVDFLGDLGLIDQASVTRGRAEHPDPVVADGCADVDQVLRALAAEVRDLYGRRFVTLLAYGSWARETAEEDSDIDLLVVLDQVRAPFEELRRMDDALWRASLESGRTISAMPVSAADFHEPRVPVIIQAKAEAVSVS